MSIHILKIRCIVGKEIFDEQRLTQSKSTNQNTNYLYSAPNNQVLFWDLQREDTPDSDQILELLSMLRTCSSLAEHLLCTLLCFWIKSWTSLCVCVLQFFKQSTKNLTQPRWRPLDHFYRTHLACQTWDRHPSASFTPCLINHRFLSAHVSVDLSSFPNYPGSGWYLWRQNRRALITL